MVQLVQTTVGTPVGAMRLVAQGQALVGAYFPGHRNMVWPETTVDDTRPVLVQAAEELAEYFAGQRQGFTTQLKLHGTEFQRQVWQLLLGIPFGETRSYHQLAAALGRSQATRAVGAANGRNPLSLFIPCHRVQGADGRLTGYAGGLEVKRWLLEHELAVSGKQGQTGLF